MLTSIWLLWERTERKHHPDRIAVKKFPERKSSEGASEDAALFRASVGKVKPIAPQNRAFSPIPPRKPLLHRSAPTPEIPDILSDFVTDQTPDDFLGNGLSLMMLRKLRRGKWPVQDRLDLHGNNIETSRKLLQEFLHGAGQHQMRCVLVIHGKGLNSKEGEAVLRKLTRHWLTQYPAVLGFCNAAPRDGGSGAVLVLLKTVS